MHNDWMLSVRPIRFMFLINNPEWILSSLVNHSSCWVAQCIFYGILSPHHHLSVTITWYERKFYGDIQSVGLYKVNLALVAVRWHTWALFEYLNNRGIQWHLDTVDHKPPSFPSFRPSHHLLPPQPLRLVYLSFQTFTPFRGWLKTGWTPFSPSSFRPNPILTV